MSVKKRTPAEKKRRFELEEELGYGERALSTKELMEIYPDGPSLTPQALQAAKALLPDEILHKLAGIANDLAALPDHDDYVKDVRAFVVAAHDIAEWCRVPRRLYAAAEAVHRHVTDVTWQYPTPQAWVKGMLLQARRDLHAMRNPDPDPVMHCSPEGLALHLLRFKVMVAAPPGVRIPEITQDTYDELARNISPQSRPIDVVRRTLRLLKISSKDADEWLAAERQAERRRRNARRDRLKLV